MFPRQNNLHALRLIFAVQVLVVHVIQSQQKTSGWLDHFSGVPAFFFLSGFLIHAAYCNSDSLYEYWRNRVLRVFPALWFVTLVSVLVLIWIKGAQSVSDQPGQWLIWIIAQSTLGQAYNPALFRDIGHGVVNGVLWTITVEILFYVLLPILMIAERKLTRHAVLIFAVVSYVIYSAQPWLSWPVAMGKTAFDFLALTPMVWGWMFALGILAHKNFDLIQKFLPAFKYAIVPVVVLIMLDQNGYDLTNTRGNYVGVIYYVVLMMLVLYLAFGCRAYPLRSDFSYGLYIWHAPIINLYLHLGPDEELSLVLVFTCSLLLAVMSWYAIESPALSLKQRSINKQLEKLPVTPAISYAQFNDSKR